MNAGDTYNILDFGAVGDGVTNNAKAVQKAIDQAAKVGGRVVIPAGRFLSGTICLKSHVDLHLEKGAVLISSLDEKEIYDFARLFADDNLETGWDGGCFLFAKDATNVSISGEGTIYGQGNQVFFDDDCDGGFHESPLNVKAFRPRLTFLENVSNLTIKEITIRNSAFWTLHMAGCSNVLLEGIRILNDVRGANNDGIDPDCCRDVIVRDCIVETGDDAIVVKATKPMSEKYGSCENILISNCILHSHDSALKIGTETHGDIRNIILSDCIAKDCSRGIGIWVRDGATIEDVHVHHLIGNVLKYADAVRKNGPAMWWGNGEPIFINATYRNQKKQYPGTIRNISFDHVDMKAESSVFLAGEEACRIENIQITDLNLTLCRQGTQQSGYFDEQPSIRNVYPHQIPAIYTRCCDHVRIEGDVRYELPYKQEINPLVLQENCTALEMKLRSR